MWNIKLAALACLAVASAEDLGSGFRVVHSAWRQCEEAADPFLCLKARAVRLLDRAISQPNIPIVDGVSLVKRAEGERALSEPLEPVPADLEARGAQVDDLLWGRVAAFADTHSVQFKMPESIKQQINEVEQDQEGRGKKKKHWPLLLLGMMFKGSMLHMAIKGLALLAGKALMVSKLALLLAGIIALKKLFSGGGEKTTYEIVKQPIVSHSHQYSASHEFGGYDQGGFEGGHGGYARSLDLPYPHRLAYRNQIPETQS